MKFWIKITSFIFLVLSTTNVDAQKIDNQTHILTILKKSTFKNSFRDLKTGRKFIIYKVELTNIDSINHRIDYSCFSLETV